MQELIQSANIVGLSNRTFGDRSSQEWTLLIVTSVERRDEENTVIADYLDSITKESIRITCFSAVPLFQAGDFISKKGNAFSFLHKMSLSPLTFSNGTRVHIPDEQGALSGGLRRHSTSQSRPQPKKIQRKGRKQISKKAKVDAVHAKPTPGATQIKKNPIPNLDAQRKGTGTVLRIEKSTVTQSFSHGRTKSVAVERRRMTPATSSRARPGKRT